MECFALLIFFLLFVLVATGVGVNIAPPGPGRAYQALLRRFGGTYQHSRLFGRPRVRFRYGPTWVTITPGPTSGSARSTQAHLQWPDEHTALHVVSRDPHARPIDICGTGTVSAYDQQFERQFQITGPGGVATQRLLSDGVRWQIARLGQLFHAAGVRVSFSRGRLLIEVATALRHPEDLEQFTQCSLELFDQAMLTRSEGIEFLEGTEEAQVIEDPICLVCGEAIGNDMVICRRCRTPHHLDCWKYTGCCATYGCRETRYDAPTVARPITRPREPDPTDDT